ncbi:hypothetical protein BKA70DRAFT_1491784 [Coprinopsis sp. MPI-PUGE-AT-0042]|nr:hypothetical protein BKA70DRAFT_1491784 [Coprinopsis sp. MPI-PUGE-AT-0042]
MSLSPHCDLDSEILAACEHNNFFTVSTTIRPRWEEHMAATKSAIAQLTNNILSDESALSAIEEQLKALQEQQQSYETKRRALSLLLSPIRNLPVEMLGEVIKHACHRNSPMEAAARAELTRLRCVCRKWDKAAKNEPTLWRSLEFERFQTHRWSGQSLSNIMQWLKRGKRNLRLCLPSLPPEVYRNGSEHLLYLLTTTGNWADLSVYLPLSIFSTLLQQLSTPQINTWTRLHTLTLRIVSPPAWEGRGCFLMDLGAMCSLKTLRLRLCTKSDMPSVTIVHPTVEHLILEESTIRLQRLSAMVTVQGLPKLRHLTLDMPTSTPCKTETEDTTPSPLHVFQDIETIIVRGTTEVVAAFQGFTFPCLKKLHLELPSSHRKEKELGKTQIKVISSLLSRSTSHLSILSLGGASTSERHFAHLISSVTTCSQLRLMNGHVIEWISPKVFRDRLIRLEKIVSKEPFFHSQVTGGFDPQILDNLAYMLRCRCEKNPTAPTLVIVNPGAVPDDKPTKKIIRDLKQQGLLHLQDCPA